MAITEEQLQQWLAILALNVMALSVIVMDIVERQTTEELLNKEVQAVKAKGNGGKSSRMD